MQTYTTNKQLFWDTFTFYCAFSKTDYKFKIKKQNVKNKVLSKTGNFYYNQRGFPQKMLNG